MATQDELVDIFGGSLSHNVYQAFFNLTDPLCIYYDFLVLCFYRIPVYENVCLSVAIHFLCFIFGSFSSVLFYSNCFGFLILFFIILWVAFCFPIKGRKGGYLGRKRGRDGFKIIRGMETVTKIYCVVEY